MSPAARRRRGEHAPHVHSRREIATAVGGSVAVVAVTLLLIWMLRPGSASAFSPGSGGILHRQPRVGWVLFIAAGVLGLAAWWIWRSESRLRNKPGFTAVASAVIIVGAVAVSLLWPKGILRHYASTPKLTPPVTTPATTPVTVPRSTAPKAPTTTRPNPTPTATATTRPAVPTSTAPSTTAASTTAP